MKTIRKITALMIIMLLSCMIRAKADDYIITDLLFSGNVHTPLDIQLDSIHFSQYTPFDDVRTESFNRLIQHLSMGISADQYSSRSDFFVDQDLIFSFIQQQNEQYSLSQYSFAPDVIIEQKIADDSDISFSSFLDKRFFVLNQLLDDLYIMFEKIPSAYPEKAKTEKVSLNYTGYGKGVKKMTFSFSAEEVKNSFPSNLMMLSESQEARDFLDSLAFDGPQKIILVFDTDDHLLRVSYDGKTGFSDNDLRKLSVVCRSVRNNYIKKDKLTVKSPSVKGYNRDNIVYERSFDATDQEHQRLSFDYQLDNRYDKDRNKIHFSADISLSDSVLSGNIIYDIKRPDSDNTIVLKPEFQIIKDGECAGILEITRKTGKIVLYGLSAHVSLSAGKAVGLTNIAQSTTINSDSEAGTNAYSDLQKEMASILVRRLISLPKEDIDFLNHDIDDTEWSSLFDSII